MGVSDPVVRAWPGDIDKDNYGLGCDHCCDEYFPGYIVPTTGPIHKCPHCNTCNTCTPELPLGGVPFWKGYIWQGGAQWDRCPDCNPKPKVK